MSSCIFTNWLQLSLTYILSLIKGLTYSKLSIPNQSPRSLLPPPTSLHFTLSHPISHPLSSKMSENYVAPGQQRYLRACMVCSIVMTHQRFRDEGCPNCEEFLHLQGSSEQIESCTSSVFEGLIAIADPTKSWIAKYNRLDGYVRGTYANKVLGQLPDEIRTMLEEEYRIQYIP